MRRRLLIAITMLAVMGLVAGLVSAPSVRAQENASLKGEMKARQQFEASALKAQHQLEKNSPRNKHLSKAQRKQMRLAMKQENRQMRQAHKAQWRDLKAQDRWNKQHEKDQGATPISQKSKVPS